MMFDSIRSPFAGSWYSADPAELKTFFAEAAGEVKSDPGTVALILPHAGYVYSGTAAALAAAKVRGLRFERVILLAPSHRAYLENRCCVPSASAFETPLGKVNVDTESVARLLKSPLFCADDRIQREEHAAQIELPLLQEMLQGGFAVLPLIVGCCSAETLKAVAAELKSLTGKGTLLVASSDFTHYGAAYGYVPFREPIRENLKKLDFGAFDRIEEKNPERFRAYIEKTGATICGAQPIELLLRLLPENVECSLEAYYTSGDVTGDFSSSVSYLSASFHTVRETEGDGETLTGTDRKLLLELARATIARKFHPDTPLPDLSALSPAAYRKCGVFVTLNIGDALRGCIGEILPVRPLVKGVAARALSAAFHDPRFFPLRESELGEITIEISALTPPHPVASWQEIELGRHGILLQKGDAGAVFLPQVAPEQGWTLEETLTHLALKAGLNPDDWREGASFEVFEAIVFREK